MELLILSAADVKKALRLPEVIEGVRSAYRQKSDGLTATWPSVEYHFEEQQAAMDIRSGCLLGEGLHGSKMLNHFPGNARAGLPALNGILTVFDSHTGFPLGTLDASYITSMRTGAACAIGAETLARENSETLLLVGAGRQAIFLLAATLERLPGIRRVLVFSPRNPAHAVAFSLDAPGRLQEEFGLERSGVRFEPATELRQALAESDIVITATRATQPLVPGEWLKPGTHLSCMGADMRGKQEIDPRIFLSARTFADDIVQCTQFGELEYAFRHDMITVEEIAGEIGDVLTGKVPGRTEEAQTTVFDATGLAILDLITAKTALETARRAGLGTTAQI